MSRMLPAFRPQLTRPTVEAMLHVAGVKDLVAVLAIRGYCLATMGDPKRNDRGIYDDAIFVVAPTVFGAFNANTDPSVNRAGIASLCLGVHRYRPGNHGLSKPGGGYPAFRPATPGEQLPVTRDGVVNPKPGIAINIHRGSNSTTSSEGCQTIPPAQWDEFYGQLRTALRKHQQETFPYVLTLDPRLTS